MFQKILVPLDGSELAECVLPYVEDLAKGGNAEEVVLVSVTERVTGFQVERGAEEFRDVVPAVIGKMQRQAQRYLRRVERGLRGKGFNVRSEVLLGKPAEQIADYAANNGIDLIAMSSHGRSGPSRWAYGSVADKVFRSTCVPLLMIRAPGCVLSI